MYSTMSVTKSETKQMKKKKTNYSVENDELRDWSNYNLMVAV